MLAVDTNVLVRFFTKDEPRQTSRAGALLKEREVWIAKTVLLETEWVLTSVYGFTAEQIIGALRAVIGLPNVQVEDDVGVALALDWTSQGLDFADALHLSNCSQTDSFITFDETLAKRARRFTPVDVALA